MSKIVYKEPRFLIFQGIFYRTIDILVKFGGGAGWGGERSGCIFNSTIDISVKIGGGGGVWVHFNSTINISVKIWGGGVQGAFLTVLLIFQLKFGGGRFWVHFNSTIDISVKIWKGGGEVLDEFLTVLLIS